jgi:hypothetical protein
MPSPLRDGGVYHRPQKSPISRTTPASSPRRIELPRSPPETGDDFATIFGNPRAFEFRPRTCKSRPTPHPTPTEYLETPPPPKRLDLTLVRDRAQGAVSRPSPRTRLPPVTTRKRELRANRLSDADRRCSRPQSIVSCASLLTISSSFDLLFRVLFTFPSQYFCAIGLVVNI